MTFQEKLVTLRKGREMSQEELAEKLEVSRQAVSKWETGASLPDWDKLLALSTLFTVSADYLLREELTEPVPIGRPWGVPQEKPKRGLALWVMGWVSGGLGLVGILVFWVLSTMIASSVPAAYADETGTVWYTSQVGYAFWPFIEKYRLQALFFIFILLLCVGLFLLWSAWRRKRSCR